MEPAPVALFTYNRLTHTQKTISFLKKNDLASHTELYVYSDGAKDTEDAIKVKEVREYLSTINGFASIKIVPRRVNIGLAQNIIEGVTDVLKLYNNIIVVEDDLLTSKYFLKYMNDGLAFYENDNDVITIHGYVYPVKQDLPETFFIRGADCWGWATWRRGWELFEKDGSKLLKELKEKSLVEEFDFDNSYIFTKMLEDQVTGKNNSWAIRWNASAFLKNKLTLYPAYSLVQNIGHDNSGVHSGQNNFFDVTIYNKPIKVNNTHVHPSMEGYKAFAEYFRSINPAKPAKPGFLKRILNKFQIKHV